MMNKNNYNSIIWTLFLIAKVIKCKGYNLTPPPLTGRYEKHYLLAMTQIDNRKSSNATPPIMIVHNLIL